MCDIAIKISGENLSAGLKRHYELTLGKDETSESHHYLYHALVLAVRDELVAKWRDTRESYRHEKPKRINYLSLEFLMGRSLNNALLNLDIEEEARESLKQYACTLEELENEEMDAGLGNGGLGRLAACFLDSCASLELPVTGYGIRYQYGMFHQKISDGYQVEQPDAWLRYGNPWEIESPENTRVVTFGGRCDYCKDENGELGVCWVETQDVLAVPYDLPIPGFRNNTVNTLRLWKAEATDEFNLGDFNAGCYTDAVAAKNLAEQITMVLYPNDASEQGKELRLRQQYFLASASLQDVLHRWVKDNGEDFTHFAEKNAFQLNDTHPTAAIAELMRLLLDEHKMEWDDAWDITTRTMAYTNHTLLPEALEVWSVELFRKLLPRILDIISEINSRFCVRINEKWPGDLERQQRMSIITEGHYPCIRMAYLGIVGSFSVNGVAALHTELLKEGLFRDFYEIWPEKFNNKTNGVTHRRWLAHCNPGLKELISENIGDGWINDLDQLEELKPLSSDTDFQSQFMAVKTANKTALAKFVKHECGLDFDTSMLFDVQVKRIHEYKRQLLNILHVITLYQRIVSGDVENMHPRCVLIGGKAAPGYVMAKLIIKFINNVATVIHSDKRCADYLRVAFIPDYCVSAMETICPGADLSVQISTAGKEASGTGNMKFMMNGAVTVGTLDGANIEIRDAVGEDNFFLFGLTAREVASIRINYDPNNIISLNPDLQAVMSLIESGHFDLAESNLFGPIVSAIRSPHDPWLTAADFESYVEAQVLVSQAFGEKSRWAEMAILNTASSGRFSSDRTIRDYRDDIWMKNNRTMP